MASKSQKSTAAKIAAIASTVLWLAGFGLAFVITSGPYIWIPDFLLLLGFCPLLWIYRPGWPWLIFGGLNVAIGFFLELMKHLDEAIHFTPEMEIVRNHLAQQHSPLVWILVGFISIIFGALRSARDIFELIRRLASKNKPSE